jgi:hypothetical protein
MCDTADILRLITQDDDLVKERFSLVEISEEPALVDCSVQEQLRSILYQFLTGVKADGNN